MPLRSFYLEIQRLNAEQSAAVKLCAGIWFFFIVMEVSKNLFFSSNILLFGKYFLQASYIYLPWFGFSLVCGVVTAATLDRPVRGKSFLLPNALAALAIALMHIFLLVSHYWIFWPQAVANVTVSFVAIEQFLKWFHLELFAYAAFAMFWRWRLQLPVRSVDGSNHEPSVASGTLLLETEDGSYNVQLGDIECLLADDNYVVIYTDSEQIRVRSTLKSMLDRISSAAFQQTHRSAAVNLAKVVKVNASRVVLAGGIKVPVSRRKYKNLLNALQQNFTSEDIERPSLA